MNHQYGVWADIAKTYSRTRLTFNSDKFIALAGIARYMKTVLNDTYVAGLWVRYLPGQLMGIDRHDSQNVSFPPLLRRLHGRRI